MTILRYLPLLVLAWASIVNADHDHQPSPEADSHREIAEILASPDIALLDLFRIAELSNPGLAMARLEIEAQTGRMQQASLFPNPELSLSMEERSLDGPASDKRKVELSQALPIGGRRGASVNAARAAVARAGESTLLTRREALGQIHTWWIDQIHFRETAAAIGELTAGAERTLAIAQARFDAKASPEAHVTRAILEVFDLETARLDLERHRMRSIAEAKVLLGGIEIPIDRLRGSLSPCDVSPPDDDIDLGTHPSLRTARLGVEVVEAELVTAKKERIPDLNLFVAYGRPRPAADDFMEVGISLSLPIFDRNQGRISETTSLVARARHEERLAESELSASLSVARSNLRITRNQLDRLSSEIAPATERALTQAREGYRSGRLAFLEMVDAQRAFKEVRLRIMTLRRELALAEADLMGLLGTGPYADDGGER